MAEDNSGLKLFGFELRRAKSNSENDKEKKLEKLRSVVAPVDDDGAGFVTASGSHYGSYVDMDGGKTKDNHQLVMKYRGVASHPEVDAAIEDIVNESIVGSELDSPVSLNLDKIEAAKKIKNLMQDEFSNICGMLKFNDLGHDIFRSFYVDGRVYFHLVADEKNLKLGIQEIRPVDAAKIRKVRQLTHKKDVTTGAEVVDKIKEFYIYQDKAGAGQGVKLSPDSISYVTSGLLDPSKKKVVSYLHKALKPINQLRMMEDSLVIYRLARAPERRIFYVDVGNMPRNKAEAYMKDIMSRYRNKLVYDANTGNLKDDRKHMSMLEDFWLPRREGTRGTEVATLEGGQNLGALDDVVYFQKRMYRSLNVPVSRLEQDNGGGAFLLGSVSQMTRDEVKFQKFIDRLRKRFSMLFTGILKKQLILKGIITEQDWESWRNHIQVDFKRDNHFTELKDAEILNARVNGLENVKEYIGEYFSREWVMKNVMRMDDEDIKQMQEQIKKENAVVDVNDPMHTQQQQQDDNQQEEGDNNE
jgi:hypothetical protein